jgi:hypothetical protein
VEHVQEERTLNLHPMVAALVVAFAIGIVWAGVALGGGGPAAPAKATRAGDGPGTAFIKAKAAGGHHARAGGKADGNCPGRARAGSGADAAV